MDEAEAQYYTAPPIKKSVFEHRAVAIIESERRGEFLLEIRDAGSAKYLKGYVTLIGGAHNDDDLSPEEILQRNLREHFSEDFQRVTRGRALPYKDFYFEPPSHECCVYSVFLLSLPQDDFEQIRSMIRYESRIKKEGYFDICTMNDLLSGNPHPAVGAGLILSEYTGVQIPPNGAILEPLGMPRKYLEDYIRDFIYQRPVRISTG